MAPAFAATSTGAVPSSAESGNVLSRLAKNFGNRSAASHRKRSISTSSSLNLSRESVISSSASSSVASSQSPENNGSINIHQRQFSTGSSNSATSGGGTSSKLSSSRAQAAIKLLPSYLIDARAITQYSPSTPEGALQLSVAENQLSELPIKGLVGIKEDTGAGSIASKKERDMNLVDVLSQLASSNLARPSEEGSRAAMNVFERDMIYYQPTQGVPSLRAAMASYLQSLLVTPTVHPSSPLKFNPDNIVVGAGCNAVLENLCMVLANPGDAVLIPTPYYAAFEFDLVARASCHIVPVNTFNHQEAEVPGCKVPIEPEFYYPNKSSLEAAYHRSMEETGRAPRVLLLSHPNNPLGICYPPDVMEECIDWCREREVHLISDEIYAGSVYRKEGTEGKPTFVSAMTMGGSSSDTTSSASTTKPGLNLGPYIHLVYALSKDFALSGLRFGVAYTENEEILMPLQKLNDMCQISSQTQLLVERMMCAHAVIQQGEEEDVSQKFVDVCLKSNQDNIRKRCDLLHAWLDELEIPYLRADSGLFVWMDFREFLPPPARGSHGSHRISGIPKGAGASVVPIPNEGAWTIVHPRHEHEERTCWILSMCVYRGER